MDDTHHFGRLVDYVQLRVRAQPRGVEALLGLRGPSSQFSNPTRGFLALGGVSSDFVFEVPNIEIPCAYFDVGWDIYRLLSADTC
jgi:hypothetical protein